MLAWANTYPHAPAHIPGEVKKVLNSLRSVVISLISVVTLMSRPTTGGILLKPSNLRRRKIQSEMKIIFTHCTVTPESCPVLRPSDLLETPHVHQDQDLAQGHDSGVSNHRRSAAFSLYLSSKVQEWNTWSGFILQLPLTAIKTFSHFYTLRHLHEQNTQVPEVSPVVRLPSRTPATCRSDV